MTLDEPTAVPDGESRAEHVAAQQPFGIAICLSHFHPTVGGAERQMLQLARCGVRLGTPYTSSPAELPASLIVRRSTVWRFIGRSAR